ncbi:A/G-specific adenine glycosylase [Rhabdothermincola sp.]|uniref:A/G-specific adenine glycosylase n=1 Tax=Rhabdothermincola sp. TaxID=2820405 RepID=UPI002FE1B06D
MHPELTASPLPAPARRRLLRWGDRWRRDLPWRRTRDPWAVLVSELMLQQTQVSRVIPRYEAFLSRFPTAGACAAAEVGEVVRAWAGLGYNRRAVSVHRAATIVEHEHGGEVPDRLEALLGLPGVGPYTARAVMAFAFERDVGVVDTNVARVLARLAGRPLDRAEVQHLADRAVPRGAGWRWNQAMLDLGATVCTSRRPRCDACPVRAACSWQARGGLPPDPARGSAGVSVPQSRFEGSDRQGRGRLVRALREQGVVEPSDVAAVAGWPGDHQRAARVVASLVRDGLAVVDSAGRVRLPSVQPVTGGPTR